MSPKTPLPDPETTGLREDVARLEAILRPYTLIKNRTRYLRLRAVEIPTDRRGAHLIELTHLIDALWDAALGCETLAIPAIDPTTNRENKTRR
jgi:hypothetical protein